MDVHDGRDRIYRPIKLCDQSRAVILVHLWGQEAAEFKFADGMVMYIKDARVNHYYNELKLLAGAPAVVSYNPSTTEAQQLKLWHGEGGLEGIAGLGDETEN